MTLRLATDADADSTNPVRLLTEYVAELLADFAETDEPVSIAIAVIGKAKARPASWSLEPRSRGEVCGYAAVLLADRALSTD